MRSSNLLVEPKERSIALIGTLELRTKQHYLEATSCFAKPTPVAGIAAPLATTYMHGGVRAWPLRGGDSGNLSMYLSIRSSCFIAISGRLMHGQGGRAGKLATDMLSRNRGVKED